MPVFKAQVEAPHTRNLNWSKLVFKNSAEEGKPDLSDSVGFWKIQKKLAKFGKIRPKCTGDNGGTVEIRNTEIQSFHR
jgi:hypothetical protein